MWMVGREAEQQILDDCLHSPRPEFLVVYGRRRVGKTYLIREFFREGFSFYATGVAGSKTRDQLKFFNNALQEYGCPQKRIPEDWMEAFSRLKAVLNKTDVYRDASGRRVVFLDEVPWMDTRRSDFKSALDYFWNSWGSAQEDLLLIICGSATSWIIDHLLTDRGGFYNRVTKQIHLLPFTLRECEEFFKAGSVPMTRQQIMEAYMVFGGIPYYLTLLNPRRSTAQNIDDLCFRENGGLRYESNLLFSSLFRNDRKHSAVIHAAALKCGGVTRSELAEIKEIGDNEKLTMTLAELEQCGFIRKYRSGASDKKGFLYQIIDPFTLFSLTFLENAKLPSWSGYIGTPGYYAWRENAFEILCLNHIPEIKDTLGIRGVETMEYPWRSKSSSPGVQIDLLMDRKDGIINLCEMKCSDQAYAIDAAYEKKLLEKIAVFRQESRSRKAIHLTMVTSNGLVHNAHAGNVISEVSGEELFR